MTKILITGASGGIGRACALALAQKGFDLVLHYWKNIRAMEELKIQLSPYSIEIEEISFDFHQRDFLAKIEGLEVDGLVHTACIQRPGLLLTLKQEEISSLIQANLTHPILLMQKLVEKFFRKKRGAMVVLSSIVTQKVFRGQSIYSAVKGGLESFVRAMAYEMASKGIRINLVSPGPVDTPMLGPSLGLAGDKITRAIPMRRLGTPEEIAELVAFLMSESASFITGANFCIDGGYSLG